jgi:hypothetical protein
MDKRNSQAFRLGRDLSEATGVSVEVAHERADLWCVEWADGPTRDEMRDRVEVALAGPGYPDLGDQNLWCARTRSPRAWASRAIAARRDGSLAREVEATAPHRRRLEKHLPLLLANDTLTSEDYATLACVEALIDKTAYPDRPSAPEDEPLIEQLLAASDGDEFKMPGILRNADQAPTPPVGPQLRVIPSSDEGTSPGSDHGVTG